MGLRAGFAGAPKAGCLGQIRTQVDTVYGFSELQRTEKLRKLVKKQALIVQNVPESRENQFTARIRKAGFAYTPTFSTNTQSALVYSSDARGVCMRASYLGAASYPCGPSALSLAA